MDFCLQVSENESKISLFGRENARVLCSSYELQGPSLLIGLVVCVLEGGEGDRMGERAQQTVAGRVNAHSKGKGAVHRQETKEKTQPRLEIGLESIDSFTTGAPPLGPSRKMISTDRPGLDLLTLKSPFFSTCSAPRQPSFKERRSNHQSRPA